MDDPKAKSLKEYNESIMPRLQELCEPLKIFGISNFTYGKITKDQKFFRVCSHEKYNELFFKQNIYNQINAYMDHLKCNTFSEEKTLFFLWDHTGPLEKIRMSADMWNGISFHQIKNNYIETWAFGGSLENIGLTNFYLNNLNILKKFSTYFKSVAQDIINISDKNKTIDILFHDKSQNPYKADPGKVLEFNKRLFTKRCHLSIGQNEFNLSMREIECLFYKSQGQTAKEIARECELSPRTIETYLNNIKVKSGMANINQLIYLCKEEGLL